MKQTVQLILPTPMIGMVGLIENVKNITTQEFKKAGDLIVLVGQTFDDFQVLNFKNADRRNFWKN